MITKSNRGMRSSGGRRPRTGLSRPGLPALFASGGVSSSTAVPRRLILFLALSSFAAGVPACKKPMPEVDTRCIVDTDCRLTRNVVDPSGCNTNCRFVAGTPESVDRVDAWCAEHPPPPTRIQERCEEGPAFSPRCASGKCVSQPARFPR